MSAPGAGAFPLGSRVTLDELSRDPYRTYALLRREEPVTWVENLNMWMVTRYDDVRTILMDDKRFGTYSQRSTIYDTFGLQMLSAGGEAHLRYKAAHKPYFSPQQLRRNVEANIEEICAELVDGFAAEGRIELRSALASRLPIRTILSIYGLPLDAELRFRCWYDSFEKALANHHWDETVRQSAANNVAQFHQFLQQYILHPERALPGSLLPSLIKGMQLQLSDDEIRRNASIIFFGGISTVEALLLNAVWSLAHHPQILECVRSDRTLVPKVINETMRYLAPVQSATRHVTETTEFHGVTLEKGQTVNCMLGSANRDASVFDNPDSFDIDRGNNGKHLGFAVGPHHCLGSQLARMQAGIALDQLFQRLTDWTADPETMSPPVGHEFRKPEQLEITWQVPPPG